MLFGPLLVVAAHLVIRPLPGGRSDGDHYSFDSDVAAWLLAAALALAAGTLGIRAARIVLTRAASR